MSVETVVSTGTAPLSCLDDLLNDGYAGYHPKFEGIRVLGTRWSPKGYDLRSLLAKNHVPYQWLDAEVANRDPEVKRVLNGLPAEGVGFAAGVIP